VWSTTERGARHAAGVSLGMPPPRSRPDANPSEGEPQASNRDRAFVAANALCRVGSAESKALRLDDRLDLRSASWGSPSWQKVPAVCPTFVVQDRAIYLTPESAQIHTRPQAVDRLLLRISGRRCVVWSDEYSARVRPLRVVGHLSRLSFDFRG
jgi:hypothetical protein